MPDHEESVVESMLTKQANSVKEILSKGEHETGATNGCSLEVDYSRDHTYHATNHTNNTIRDTPDVHDFEKMLYLYPLYNGEADVEGHVCAFLTTRQANHMCQCLVVANTNASKIVEVLNLAGIHDDALTTHDMAK